MRTESENAYLVRAIDGFGRHLIVISPDYVVLAANANAMSHFGTNIVGKKCFRMLWGCEKPCAECVIKKVVRTRKPAMIHKKSSLVFKKNHCHYFYPLIENNAVDAVVMMDFDMPTLEGLEEKLHRTSAFLRNMILSSVDAVIAADMTGKIFIFNHVAAEITGYSIHEGLHQLMIWELYENDNARKIMQLLRSPDYGGPDKLKSYETTLVPKRGDHIPIGLNASIVYDGNREVATIGFFRDLREEREMRNKLEKTRLQLLQSDKMASLGKLSAGVAHQLNNPLGSIILFTKLVMEEYELPEEAVDDLNRILRDAQRCRDTVKELLEFARQTRYRIEMKDINDAIKRTLFLLERQTLFHNINIDLRLADDLPKIPVDIQQINHLLMNIIINAGQAMEGDGDLEIETRGDDETGMIRIRIADTGPGIPPNVLPHIFEPFYSTKDEGEGTGLGLSLAYSIVKEHGGMIEAKNRLEGGTEFVIELPTARKRNGETVVTVEEEAGEA